MFYKYVTDEVLDNGIHKCHLELTKTNADRIRTMTDKELTKFFIDLMQGNCPRPTSECFGECEACWLEWLKQESKA